MPSRLAAKSERDKKAAAPKGDPARRWPVGPYATMYSMHRDIGNRAIGRLFGEDGNIMPHLVGEVLRGGGQCLDPDVRAYMESRLNHDFGGVRIHATAQAARSADSIDADAYTCGKQIVFGPGLYQPRSADGMKLLAHELTHVMQQRGQAASARELLEEPQSSHEIAASQVAETFLAAGGKGNHASPLSAPPKPSAGAHCIQRQQKRRNAGRKAGTAKEPLAITCIDNEEQIVVFNRPVSLEEAKRFIWRFPENANDISPDEQELAPRGWQTRYHVNVAAVLAWWGPSGRLTDEFTKVAMKAAVPDMKQELEKRGLPEEIGELVPYLPVNEITPRVSIGSADIIPEVDERMVRENFYMFPGVWVVHEKEFPGSWLIRVRKGFVEAWQKKPGLEAYIEACNGDADSARLHYAADMQLQNYLLSYWVQGYPIDDALGMMRLLAELDLKEAVYEGYGKVQFASGVQSGLRGFWKGLAGLAAPRYTKSAQPPGPSRPPKSPTPAARGAMPAGPGSPPKLQAVKAGEGGPAVSWRAVPQPMAGGRVGQALEPQPAMPATGARRSPPPIGTPTGTAVQPHPPWSKGAFSERPVPPSLAVRLPAGIRVPTGSGVSGKAVPTTMTPRESVTPLQFPGRESQVSPSGPQLFPGLKPPWLWSDPQPQNVGPVRLPSHPGATPLDAPVGDQPEASEPFDLGALTGKPTLLRIDSLSEKELREAWHKAYARHQEGRHVLLVDVNGKSVLLSVSGSGGAEGHTEVAVFLHLLKKKMIRPGDELLLQGIFAPCPFHSGECGMCSDVMALVARHLSVDIVYDPSGLFLDLKEEELDRLIATGDLSIAQKKSIMLSEAEKVVRGMRFFAAGKGRWRIGKEDYAPLPNYKHPLLKRVRELIRRAGGK